MEKDNLPVGDLSSHLVLCDDQIVGDSDLSIRFGVRHFDVVLLN